jgi:hypothetical protein
VFQVACDKSRFDQIQSKCTGALDIQPYGVDPVFKLGTASYNPDLNDANNSIVLNYYNCSTLRGGKGTVNINSSVLGQVSLGADAWVLQNDSRLVS